MRSTHLRDRTGTGNADGPAAAKLALTPVHEAALARANAIGLAGMRKLSEPSVVCRDMIDVLEEAEPDMHLSIMTVDRPRNVLRVVSAPRLPADYLAAIDGLVFGPKVGSCGAAVSEARTVIVRDIYDHENWANFVAAADLSGMRSCWSVPIFGPQDDVIGTFAVYHAAPCEPSETQAALIEEAAKVVSLMLAQTLAHRQLSTALKRLEFATEAGGIGIWDWDEETDSLNWDDRMLTLYGVSREAFTGSIDDFCQRVDPDDLERLEREGHQALRARVGFQCEFTITRASDGKKRHIAEHCAPLIDPVTGHTHLIGINRDVTEQREQEEQLRQAQKMEAVGQLTGGVAHDLNNLLTVVLGNLELLQEHGSVDPKRQEFVNAAIKATTRGATLIDQLLSFSRRAVLLPEVLNINDTIQGVVEMLGHSLPETVELKLDLAETIWRARFDRNQFENALLNLSLNARDAMPGGGTLAIETSRVTIAEHDTIGHDLDLAPGNYVQVAVSDTGLGMDQEVALRAFEPFFTTKGVGKGSGLGLSMVYGFMKQSGGAAQIESAPGAGTRVRLFFPGHCPAKRDAGASAAVDIPRGRQSERVLVVEDEDAVRAVVVAMVAQLGYDVGQASNGAEALAMLDADGRYDVMLTDLVMPGCLSGGALAAQARALHPDLIVMFMSGYVTLDQYETNGLTEDDLLLSKPIARSQLAQTLRTMLDQARFAPAPA